MFNRLFFCEKCFHRDGPHPEDDCVIFDLESGCYLLIKFAVVSKSFFPESKGFTPHIVKIVEKDKDKIQSIVNIDFDMVCSVCSGNFIKKDNTKTKSNYEFKWSRYSAKWEKWLDILSTQF